MTNEINSFVTYEINSFVAYEINSFVSDQIINLKNKKKDSVQSLLKQWK